MGGSHGALSHGGFAHRALRAAAGLRGERTLEGEAMRSCGRTGCGRLPSETCREDGWACVRACVRACLQAGMRALRCEILCQCVRGGVGLRWVGGRAAGPDGAAVCAA